MDEIGCNSNHESAFGVEGTEDAVVLAEGDEGIGVLMVLFVEEGQLNEVACVVLSLGLSGLIDKEGGVDADVLEAVGEEGFLPG